MLTPSLVMVGAPHFFSRTTLRPFGPRVTLTASARMFIPRSRPRRASSSKAMILAIRVVPPTRNGWVTDWRPRRTDRIRRTPFVRVLRSSPDSQNYHSHGESANTMISTRPPRVQIAARDTIRATCPAWGGREKVLRPGRRGAWLSARADEWREDGAVA